MLQLRSLFFLSLAALAAAAALRYTLKDLTILGRHSGNGELSWPRSGYSFNVLCEGKAVIRMAFKVEGCTSFYLAMRVDGKEATRYHINSTSSGIDFELAGTARIEVFRISEANYTPNSVGLLMLDSLVIDGGELLRLERASKTTRLLFIGDSLTCGYGNLGTDPCSFDGSTEDILQSYPSVLADLLESPLGAAPLVHTVCYSGKGVVRNYAGAPDLTMPDYYNRSIATQADSYWNPLFFLADAVYIMLGSNDYSTQPIPEASTFIEAYVSLLRRASADYPDAAILAACAPPRWAHHVDQCANIEAAVAAFKLGATATKLQYVQPVVADAPSYGCDGHPSAQTHKEIAESLFPTFLSVLS